MALTTGTRIGPYEIAGRLGAGGMGEVYKARDTRLGRTVAIKVLAEHVAADPELKQRFEREARTLAAPRHSGDRGCAEVSPDGPVWNPNGRELFYRSGDRMMAVAVTTALTFSAGRPEMLFKGDYVASPFPATGVTYDVTRDGQRFLLVKDAPQAANMQIHVVVNWHEELKRLVPIDGAGAR